MRRLRSRLSQSPRQGFGDPQRAQVFYSSRANRAIIERSGTMVDENGGLERAGFA